jgi:hypothetical protein
MRVLGFGALLFLCAPAWAIGISTTTTVDIRDSYISYPGGDPIVIPRTTWEFTDASGEVTLLCYEQDCLHVTFSLPVMEYPGLLYGNLPYYRIETQGFWYYNFGFSTHTEVSDSLTFSGFSGEAFLRYDAFSIGNAGWNIESVAVQSGDTVQISGFADALWFGEPGIDTTRVFSAMIRSLWLEDAQGNRLEGITYTSGTNMVYPVDGAMQELHSPEAGHLAALGLMALLLYRVFTSKTSVPVSQRRLNQ